MAQLASPLDWSIAGPIQGRPTHMWAGHALFACVAVRAPVLPWKGGGRGCWRCAPMSAALQISHAVRSLHRSFREEFESDLPGEGSWEEEEGEEGEGEGPAAGPSVSSRAGQSTSGRGGRAAAGGGPQPEAQEAREHAALVKASAWYYVTYHPDCQREGRQGARLFSFAWVVADRLAQIKAARRAH